MSQFFWKESNRNTNLRSGWGKYVKKWMRPTEITSSPSLWGSKGVRPAAVNQGYLGDCWFLASMSAIGEWPDRIKAVFKNKDYSDAHSKKGIFQLNMYMYGEPLKVVIDDKLTMSGTSTSSTILTRKSPNGAYWGPLMEKAGGKYYGVYENMNGGWMDESIYALAGVPSFNMRHTSFTADQAWAMYTEFDQKKYIMTAGNFNKAYNLVAGHAYSLIGTAVYNKEKLVKVRNPWGSERYTGPWSDKDTAKWTAAAK
jgi:hypothetical protein